VNGEAKGEPLSQDSEQERLNSEQERQERLRESS
jgi:hypothetical protein